MSHRTGDEMPSRRRELTAAEAGRHVRERAFAPAGGGRVGAEVEWLTRPAGNPTGPVDFLRLRAAVDALAAEGLPAGGRLTFEPGGQVELSSAPQAGPGEACQAMATDLTVLRRGLDEAGFTLSGLGLDPLRPPRRVLDTPRYAAMEAYFDTHGPEGRTMMAATAAIQVNVDLGPEPAATWRLAHRLGPVLAAAFANSPLAGGRRSGWHSSRLANWFAIDPTRTGSVETAESLAGEADPGDVWARYALAAGVMLVRLSPEDFRPPPRPMSFAGWLETGSEWGWPTLDDLDYHLTTLFPPVRPKGWLELRVVDALPEPWWRVPVAVAGALLGDDEAADAAGRAAAPVAGCWQEAARHGLGHPELALAARTCFAAALPALGRLEADATTLATVEDYADRYVDRGRCPADDVISAWGSRTEEAPAAG
jgi:glutamate--cysteine ligase